MEQLSGGRLGYAHIRGMNDGAYREIFEEVFGRAVDKEAIVLDTRFNGGGNLVEPLTVFLSGQVYYRAVPRGRQIGVEPGMRWTKPSIVVMNEGNYSDAHCFPTAYKALKLGRHGRHAGAGHLHLRLVGAPAGQDADLRHSPRSATSTSPGT